jgi:hypothetical protein
MKRIVASIVLLCLAGATLAQLMSMLDPVRMRSMPLTMLNHPAVQGELKLTGKQKSDLKKINDDLNKSSQSARGNDFAAFGQLKAKMEESNKQALDLLDEPQRARFTEIRYQVLGMRSLNEPEVQTALALSDEQKAAAKAFEKAEFDGLMGAAPKGPKAMEAWTKGADEREKEAAKILNADQAAKFETLKGKPFKDAKKVRGN